MQTESIEGVGLDEKKYSLRVSVTNMLNRMKVFSVPKKFFFLLTGIFWISFKGYTSTSFLKNCNIFPDMNEP